MISLSGLREDDGSDENLGPLINAGGFLCTVHTKPSNKRSPALYWPRTKLARGFSGTRESSGITKLTVLCPLLYHEIGLLKRYYESVLPFRIYHSVEPRVNLINDPGQTVSSFDWTKSNWTRSGHRSRVLSQLSSIILNILTFLFLPNFFFDYSSPMEKKELFEFENQVWESRNVFIIHLGFLLFWLLFMKRRIYLQSCLQWKIKEIYEIWRTKDGINFRWIDSRNVKSRREMYRVLDVK